jgi:hypothetical protein
MGQRTVVCQTWGAIPIERTFDDRPPATVGDLESWRKRCKDRNAVSVEEPRACPDLLAALKAKR